MLKLTDEFYIKRIDYNNLVLVYKHSKESGELKNEIMGYYPTCKSALKAYLDQHIMTKNDKEEDIHLLLNKIDKFEEYINNYTNKDLDNIETINIKKNKKKYNETVIYDGSEASKMTIKLLKKYDTIITFEDIKNLDTNKKIIIVDRPNHYNMYLLKLLDIIIQVLDKYPDDYCFYLPLFNDGNKNKYKSFIRHSSRMFNTSFDNSIKLRSLCLEFDKEDIINNTRRF